jgi:hypothetical protein
MKSTLQSFRILHMKTQLSLIAIASLALSGLASAQTPPSSQTTPSNSTSSTPSSMGTPSSSPSAATDSPTYGSGDSSHMKDCLATQKASNPQIADADAKLACNKTDAQ